ncbi:transposon Ty3-I Gag-Pol polyprotein [Trichonephila clavipes]|uniref:Transposon Ty3-I Gag-Pol polyprotein n=1 Tax=Trichonephila clavipes TaxID=2585209 RepID=A0A8X7BK33_TRICX|nr:transposon Ty3-I Gag-Pol polyprotein [Trichonephila clavipes]
MLSMYVDAEQKNWDEILPFLTFAYNTAKQETTGFTPFYLLHSGEAEATLDTMLPFCPNDFDYNNITKIARRRITTASPSAHSESSRQRSLTLRFQRSNGILRSRRSRMGLYPIKDIHLIVQLPVLFNACIKLGVLIDVFHYLVPHTHLQWIPDEDVLGYALAHPESSVRDISKAYSYSKATV